MSKPASSSDGGTYKKEHYATLTAFVIFPYLGLLLHRNDEIQGNNPACLARNAPVSSPLQFITIIIHLVNTFLLFGFVDKYLDFQRRYSQHLRLSVASLTSVLFAAHSTRIPLLKDAPMQPLSLMVLLSLLFGLIGTNLGLLYLINPTRRSLALASCVFLIVSMGTHSSGMATVIISALALIGSSKSWQVPLKYSTERTSSLTKASRGGGGGSKSTSKNKFSMKFVLPLLAFIALIFVVVRHGTMLKDFVISISKLFGLPGASAAAVRGVGTNLGDNGQKNINKGLKWTPSSVPTAPSPIQNITSVGRGELMKRGGALMMVTRPQLLQSLPILQWPDWLTPSPMNVILSPLKTFRWEYFRLDELSPPPVNSGTVMPVLLALLQSSSNAVKSMLCMLPNLEADYIKGKMTSLMILKYELGSAHSAALAWVHKLTKAFERSSSSSSGKLTNDMQKGKRKRLSQPPSVDTSISYASVASELGRLSDVVIVTALLILLVFRSVQDALKGRKMLNFHFFCWGALMFLISSCLSDAFSWRDGIKSGTEALVISRHAYAPSAFACLCLAVALADAWAAPVLTPSAPSGRAETLVLTREQRLPSLFKSLLSNAERVFSKHPPPPTPYEVPTGRTTDNDNVTFVRVNPPRSFFASTAYQLLCLAALLLAVDACYKTFHPEPACFIVEGEDMKGITFVCCPA